MRLATPLDPRTLFITAALGTTALGSCEQATQPIEPTHGRVYELASVSGAPLPSLEGEFSVLSGTLILGNHGSCLRLQKLAIHQPGAPPTVNNDWTCSWTDTTDGIQVTWELDGVPDLQSSGTMAEGSVALNVPIDLACIIGPCDEPWTEEYVEVTPDT